MAQDTTPHPHIRRTELHTLAVRPIPATIDIAVHDLPAGSIPTPWLGYISAVPAGCRNAFADAPATGPLVQSPGRTTGSVRAPTARRPAGGEIMTASPVHVQVYPVEEDTRLFLEAALAEIRAADRVLEVGTGSGHVAASLVRRATRVVALDINPHAAAAARSLGLEVVRSDLLAGIRGPFDLVLFNPPYLPTDPAERLDDWLEYALDGGSDGRRTIARFLGELDRILAGGGRALLLISTLTGPSEVAALARAAGLRGTVVLERRVEDETLMVLRLERGCADD